MSIDVTYDNNEIPQSPLKVNAVPGCDASRVKAYGPGLNGGVTNTPQIFTVDIKVCTCFGAVLHCYLLI